MIGIFDSGIGGLTVLKEILKVLPNYKYLYYSDSLNNPYGDKLEEELKIITKNIIEYLINQGCQIIVIACNTASCICKDYLREIFDIPIIAIEPAYKMVHDYNREGKTLILGTKGTIESKRFKVLFEKYNNHKTNIYECSGLADLIEENKLLKIKSYLNINIKKFQGVENVVLGCTHYPLIKKELKSILGNINFFDGSQGVAKRLKEVTLNIKLNPVKQEIIFIDSSNLTIKEKRFYTLLNK